MTKHLFTSLEYQIPAIPLLHPPPPPPHTHTQTIHHPTCTHLTKTVQMLMRLTDKQSHNTVYEAMATWQTRSIFFTRDPSPPAPKKITKQLPQKPKRKVVVVLWPLKEGKDDYSNGYWQCGMFLLLIIIIVQQGLSLFTPKYSSTPPPPPPPLIITTMEISLHPTYHQMI